MADEQRGSWSESNAARSVALPQFGEFVRQPFTSLLVSLLLLFALGSVVSGVVGRLILSTLQSAVLVSGVWSVAKRGRVFVAALVLAVPALLLRWILYVTPGPTLGLTYLVLSTCFFILIAVTVLGHVFRHHRVDMDTINGAVCVYFFIGIIFANVFSLAELFRPGSFVFAEHHQADMVRPASEGIRILSYFSFVTLTTLGYGDISPATPMTRFLATLEATIGQLYLTILVARLVGLHVASRPRATNADSE